MKDRFDSPNSNQPRSLPLLPSILDLGRLAHAAMVWEDDPTDEQKKKMATLCARETAFRDLLLTFRAKTLGDAVVQLYAGFIATDDLQIFDKPPADQIRDVQAVRRALIGAIPVVAEAAGLDLADIGAEYITGFADDEFPAET